MIKEIIEEKNIFDNVVNEYFIKQLSMQKSWTIDTDYIFNTNFDPTIPNNYSDTGMLLKSFAEDNIPYINNHNANINEFGNLIFNVILEKIKDKIQFSNIVLKRFLWNYYNTSSCGFFHTDTDKPNHCSIIYYLNTCDGYTEIDDKKFFSESGKCVLFDSNIMHRGVGPTKDKKRFLLNIVFQYEKAHTK